MGFNLDGSVGNSKSKRGSFDLGDKSKVTYMPLTTTDGRNFGDISYSAMKAIENNTLDSYTAKDDKEREVLYKYRLATSAEVKKDDGTSLGFITQEGLRAISENNIEKYTPINADEKKTIDSYVAYATQKRQEKLDNYKATANEALISIENKKSDVVDDVRKLNSERNMYNRGGSVSGNSKWKIKDTRTAKEKREGKPIPKSEGRAALASAKKDLETLNKEAEAMVDTINNIEKYATIVYNDTGFTGQFQANKTKGRLSQDTSQAYNDYVVSPTDANRMRADVLSALSEQFEINNKDALTSDDEDIGKLEETVRDWAAVSFANYLPQFFDQTKASIKGAVGGAATGAMVGSAVPGFGTATGAVYGARTGWVAGASQQMYETTRGMVFKTLIDAGYDEETALEAANDEALISSVIEGAGEIFSMATLGTGKIFTKLVPGAAKKITSNTVLKGVKGFVTKTGAKISKNAILKATTSVAGVALNAAGEYGEEYSQEAVSIANERRLKNPNARGKLNLVGETLSLLRNMDAETEARLHAAGTEGFRIGLMMGGGTKASMAGASSASNHISNAMTGMKIKKADADESGLVQSVVDIGLQQPKDTKAYKTATKLKSSEKISAPKLGNLSKMNKGETVNVGETYYDTKSKSYLNIVGRNDSTTTVTIVNSDGVGFAKEFSNETVDNLTKNSRYVMVANDAQTTVEEATPTTEAVEEETPSTETVETETPTTDNTVIEETSQRNTFTEELDEIASTEMPTVSVGDTFVDNNTGKVIKVVGRDDNATTIEITTDGKTDTNQLPNKTADTLAVDDKYSKAEANVETPAETVSAPDEMAVAENVTTTTEDDEIKQIENLAVKYGANNTTREKIVSSLNALQNKLAGTDISVKSVFNGIQNLLAHSGITMENEKTSGMFWKQAALDLEAYSGENYTVDDIRHLLSVRPASEDNTPTADETTSDNEEVTNNDVELAEGEILSLKHTKNVYSVFKGATRIIVSKDFISDSYVAIPFSEEALEQVKKVAKKANIENRPELTFEKIYNKDNDVVIQGNPKINEIQHVDYVFKINGKYYIAQQKYIDVFNNGKNVIKANSENYSTPWTVHDEKGNFVALFCPVSNDKMTDEIYSDLKSVSEIKAEKTKDKVSPETKVPETNTVADDVESVERQPEVTATEIENSNVTETPESVTETEENEIVNTSQNEKVSESTPTLTDKCVLYETTHTKTGEKLWVISLKDKISSDEYKTLSGNVKKVGGYYSRFTKTPDGKAMPGFVFTTEPSTDVIKTFNDFFNVSDEMSKSNEDNNLDNSEDKVLKSQSESDIMEEKTTKESEDNVEPQSEVLAGESGNDDRGLRSESSEPTEQETTEGVDGQSGENSRETLPQSTGTDGNRPDVGNDSEGVHGRNDANVSESGIDGNGTEIAEETPETIETEDKSIEKKRPSNKENFVITDDIAREFDNTPPSAEDNIKAIELLLTLENEGRPATAEEKKILAKYKGWGGIDTRRLPWELSRKLYDLYDGQQLREMQSSQNNAFFTPTGVIDAMYNGLKRMGFRGGNVLESSMGVGNFFGRMPVAMTAKSALTGVELESYTARIAQYLYPGATVINKPFQDVAIRNSSYDLVIGNVPFGTNKISYNKKKYSLHNYFIVSSLDKVKDGGIVAVITSSGTLDSYSVDARSAIMDRADVVACYKLPAGVFSRNASTDVQTDLLILRKRASDAKPSGDSILNVTTTDDGLRLNEYFVKHPENILGTLAKGTNAWGEITTVLDNGGFYDKLNEAMNKLPKDLISGKVELKPIETIVSTSSKPRFFEKNGKIYADDGAGTATAVPTTQEKTIRDYMAVRDAYKDLLAAYDNDVPEADIKPLRDKLTKVYDDFYKNHGAITGDGKKKVGNKKSAKNTFLEADADYYLVSGLERYNSDEHKFEKSALFEKDTLRKKKVTSVDASSDALAVSLNESGRIDFARMSELTGKTEKQLAEELKGEIVLTPDGEYVLTDIYLSGNIYEKLEAVKDKPEFKEQKEMLEKVLPTPKDASSIMVKLGANYIDTKYIEQFSREVFNTRIEVSKNSSGEWLIEGVRQSRYGDILNVKYGCSAFNAIQLLEKVLNDSEITAKKTVKVDGKSVQVYDEKMTEVARQKAEDIKEAFESWIFRDSERRTDIVDKYNRTYNNYRPLNYEHIADKLSFDSMDETLKGKLYPHQKKGIARFLFGGNILFAHGVGTGKTFEMIASVMEAKRMGIINKVAMVVPNNKVVDFKKDIAQAYPNAKVLVIDTANKKRQTMLGLVNSNDWDIVLIARTTFTKIPVSPELQANYINQQLEELDRQIAEAESDRNISKRKLKGLYTQRDNLEQKLKDLDSETKRDENSVDFEKLGFDCICVDEAHNYKSITTLTKLDIKGLASGSNAQQANDMLMKLDYMRSVDGRIIFGTGTPITNTVSEIYNMMRMVRPDILEDAGIHSLDEWVNTFAKIETHTEIGVDNKVKNKSTQTIRSFVNGTEMVGMFRQFADVVFTQDVVKNLPKAKHIVIEIEGTPELRQVESQISNVIASASGKDTLSAYTKAMAMANAAAIDLKMLSGAESDVNIFKDYSLEELEYENSKINTMCNYVYDEYKASNNIKGTQIIFCDGGAGSGDIYSFNVHNDIVQKLVERGIPEKEIVIVKNQKDAQLEELFDKVNSGEVRVLIGTSRKMAEGLNVQKRVVAIHHPTVTFKPSDLEQGDARGVRAGNINKEVRIYRYLQGNTFDSYKWQAIDRKGEMINKALRGEAVDELEDIGADDESDAGVDAATAMAITSGNPLVKEKIDIDKEVKRLKTLKQNFMNEYYRYADAVAKNPNKIRQLTEYAQRVEQDIALRNKQGDKAKITVKGKVFEKQTDANKALVNAVNSAPKNGQFTKIGEYNGFDIMFKGDTGGLNYALVVKGANEYSVEYAGSGNNIARIDGVLKRLDGELTRVKGRVETLKSDLDFAKQEVDKPFEQEKALTEALEKQKDITYRYEHFGETQNTEQTETEETEDVSYSVDDYAPTFYSHMSNTIDGMKDGKHGASSVIPYLKGKGVKDEEIKWSGIEAFLDGKKSVTKAELQEFAQGSQLQIEETVLEGVSFTTMEHQENVRTGEELKDIYIRRKSVYYDELIWDENENVWVSEEYGHKFSSEDSIKNYYGILENGTRWGEYKLKGGKNYRELIFKLPNSLYTNPGMQTHWGESAQGILAHTRLQDFKVNGKKMLFIEEIQSDWHNEGHRVGYVDKGQKQYRDIRNESADAFREFYNSDVMQSIQSRMEKAGYGNTVDIFSELFEGSHSAYNSITEAIGNLTGEEKAYIEEVTKEEANRKEQLKDAPLEDAQSKKAIPDAPFRDNYHEYVLKSLIRMAAEQGYDSIGWTTADIQSARWSDEFAEGYRIEYDQDIPKFLNKYGKKWGTKVGTTKLNTGLLKNTEVWSMPITDAMKQSVLYEGQALYSTIEGEENSNEQTGNLLSDGNGKWEYSSSAKRKTKRLDGRSSRYREERKTARERRKYCQTLKTSGLTEQKIIYGHECEVIPEQQYTPRMTKIAERNKKDGIDETVFVTGNFAIPFAKDKNGNPKKSRGAYIKANGRKIIIVQYDNEFYLPEQIIDHEKIHDRRHTPLFEKAKNIIINSLSVAEKKNVLEKLARDYNGIIEGNEEAIIEEFIANVLSDMDYEYFGVFSEIQKAYWKGDEQFIDRYKASEYSETIDAGGINTDILDSIGVGNEFRLSESFGDIPYNEYMQLREYIVKKNNRPTALLPVDCTEIGNNFYTWRNTSKNDFTVFDSIPIVGNEDIINEVRSEIKNGTYRGTESFNSRVNRIRGGKRDRTILDSRAERATSYRSDDRLSIRQSESDTLGHPAESSGIKKEHLKAVDSTDEENIGVRYSTSVDDDIAELTPERKKEIFEQFERDRVGVDKPTLKQIWGERAEWIAHNMTRVFPDIPERGERGTFFAEFRKMMIQWKALPQTSMFMTQDKLNKMTKDLTPDEFKTFSELVYFLDLQEEAQMQKDRGYEEILLPNEIAPHEVNQIIDVLNKEATDNVRAALEKRRQIWDSLKEQYITLNQYIGFNTDGRFNRKNYYHHQVIEYMNQGGKGVAKGKDIEIKAGRGWLKERQGSTKATNTDFLAVEYKAMLQMQYDIYVANMLGKIKDQYDIKPQLEKQAFDNNKNLLNKKIAEEATDENGNVMIDDKGKPDSETYRQQQWYNQRIMFGFSGLFDLAESDMLPTFNGQYGNVIRALGNNNLNVSGLYNYVGELAAMELSDTATEEEIQAQISARTVLKYTSQKKAWVKEVLANGYQTWETLAEGMKDTHSIHQPRRGNYFYTKEVINEDAFNKAFNDMIVGLVAGENGVDTTADMKKLFEQYSETVRLMGAAYEQWVIPNEIETTMNKVANPKQANVVSKLSRSILSAWKGWSTSVNPLRTVKFGLRNIFGDLDAVIAGNPKLVVYSKRAVEEIYQAMKHKKYSSEFMEWVERGGYSSLIFANEMDTEMQDKLFSHLKDKEGLNIFKIPAKLFEGYYNGVESAHNFREAILRYSAYLHFKNEIIKNGGNVKDNVASNRYIVQGLHSVEDKAYQLSKDLLGAYDEVATMGQALRRHAIPFYSFTETNLKRYYRLFENIIMSNDNIPKKVGKLLLKALMVNTLTLLMVAWNKLVMDDEDDELPPSARNVPHITLGRIGDKSLAFRQLGSFSELLEWIGFEDYQWTEEDKTAALDKAVGMISPVFKTPVELLTGLNFYPSITQPRAIRDNWEHFFSTLGADDVYRAVAGKPTRGWGDIATGAVIYSYDYKESAYYEILDIKREYQGDTDNTIYGQTPKSNALYYMKTAIRYKDKKAALKYLDEYFENGGTAKGITQSIAMLNPMYGYTGEDTIAKGQEFVKSLSDDEKDKLKIAINYYENDLMLPENVSAMLRKKNITEEQAKNLLRNYINSKCK